MDFEIVLVEASFNYNFFFVVKIALPPPCFPYAGRRLGELVDADGGAFSRPQLY